MIEILILFILHKREFTLYSIAKEIDNTFHAFSKASFGTISPAVKRLEKLECIQYQIQTSIGGKPSKVCMITEAGEKYLKKLLLNIEFSNTVILNNVKLSLMCSEVLSKEEKREFFHRLDNYVSIYKIFLEKQIKEEIVDEVQKEVLELNLKQTLELLSLIRILYVKNGGADDGNNS